MVAYQHIKGCTTVFNSGIETYSSTYFNHFCTLYTEKLSYHFLIILSHKLVNAACIGSHAYAEESCCMWLNFLVALSCCEIQT